MPLRAIIFGSIGTLTETSELQREAFNAAFAGADLDWHWDAVTYRRLVADGTSGGQQRIARYARSHGGPLTAEVVEQVHTRKSEIFQQAMADGIPVNAGVVETIAAARTAGIKLGFASTTSAANIDAMFAATGPALTRSIFDELSSEDTVANGKPAPDVYVEILHRLGVHAAEAVAIEDTMQSAEASRSAGIATLIVPGRIARDQDFGGLPVVPSLAGFGLDDFAALLTRVPAE